MYSGESVVFVVKRTPCQLGSSHLRQGKKDFSFAWLCIGFVLGWPGEMVIQTAVLNNVSEDKNYFFFLFKIKKNIF